MRPEVVVLPAPTIGQALGLSHRGEQLGIEELIPEPSGERLGKAVLPVTDSDGQAEPALLVDHVQELEPPSIGGGVELEVHGPHLLRVLSLVTPNCAVTGPGLFLLARDSTLEPFIAPESVHTLVVHEPALWPQQAVSHSPAPADVLCCDLPEASAQLCLFDIDDLSGMALGVAVVAHNPAGKAVGNPEMGQQGHNSPAAQLRAQKFPSASSHGLAGPAAIYSFLQLSLSQMLLEATVLLIQLGQSLDLLGLHAAVEPTLSVIGGLRNLQGSAGVSDVLPLGEKLLRWLLLRRGL